MGAGAALVGEEGPELLELPAGARVTPLQGGGQPVQEVVNHYHFAEGAITIPARDLDEMRSVADFFARLPQVARAGVV